MVDQKSHDNPLKLKFSKTFTATPDFIFKALTIFTREHLHVGS